MERALRRARIVGEEEFRRHRYVVFSDIHKGDRRRSDDFRRNEALLLHAWRFYLDQGYRLVLAGDIEEGWECRWQDAAASYPATFELERRFNDRGPGHYLRVVGNHDEVLRRRRFVRRHLQPRVGEVQTAPALCLGDSVVVVHGHQGELWSDRFSARGRLVSRFLWRPLQEWFGLSVEGIARNVFMKNARDQLLYDWAVARRRLLIAGHTHRAVFRSRTELQGLRERLSVLDETAAAEERGELVRRIRLLEWQERSGQPPEKTSYFNSGCSVYRNGATAIELADGDIRLVRWDRPALERGQEARQVLESESLPRVLNQL